ncbi:hypothetical protein [Hymenobacter sp. AT01-02]|uniref:hypothetical protein n=1 Tax=Hymenobacter sp. AT01-02 TaxID=1571877 RepID=UPI0005F14375|nr:hypothetical protein [Hymenobacter sp. AT01-02]
MKLFRNILLAVLALLLVSGIGGYFYMRKKFEPGVNQLSVTGLPATCTFVWKADSTAQPVVAHAALLVPARLPGCPRTCYFQFDTGAPTSILYARSLAALRGRYPATTQTLLPQADTVRNFQFGLGSGSVQARKIKVLDYGRSTLPADSTEPFIIGTLGTDALEGRVLVLNYSTRQFSLRADVPTSLTSQTVFVPLDFASRRVMLNAAVQGKPRQLLFDSGSSAFALLTSRATWEQMAQPQARVRHAAVNSLGTTLTAHTVATAATLGLGQVAVPLHTVTYIEGTSFMQSALMRFSGMGGMLGNEPFAERTIVLDVRGRRFGLVHQ